MIGLGGVYICERGFQPICLGINERGELIWENRRKEPWHQKMFPVYYGGDFGEQWLWKTLHEKGIEWKEEEI